MMKPYLAQFALSHFPAVVSAKTLLIVHQEHICHDALNIVSFLPVLRNIIIVDFLLHTVRSISIAEMGAIAFASSSNLLNSVYASFLDNFSM